MRYFEDHPVMARRAFEALPSAIALIDEQGVIADLNERLAKMSGFSSSDLVGQDLGKIIANLNWDPNRSVTSVDDASVVPLVMGQGQDLLMRCANGERISINVTCSHLEIDDRSWALVAIDDNTAQRRSEEARIAAEGRSIQVELEAAAAIAQSEQRFRLAFEGNMAPMVFSDRLSILLGRKAAMHEVNS